MNNHPLSPCCLHLSFLPHKPCEIDELVAKIEGAWEKKDDVEKEDIQEKIQKVVESPSSAFSLFGKKNPRSEAVLVPFFYAVLDIIYLKKVTNCLT